MKFTKQKLTDLKLCYAIGMFKGEYSGKVIDSFLVATEKEGPCLRFDTDGNFLEEVWSGPGGVMTITQVPGRNDQILATQEFYSPNCGAEDARIVSATRGADGKWEVRTLCDLPYVHRFGILRSDNGNYLVACTIKSDCEYREDWRFPGKIFVAKLPEELEQFDADKQLELTVLRDEQLKNHGFYLLPDKKSCLISTEEGVYHITPPSEQQADWQVEELLQKAVSDICLVDFDGDGREELVTLADFHGDELSVYKQDDAGKYSELIYRHPEPLPFLHAIWSDELAGKKVAVLGHRKGDRDLFVLDYVDGEFQLINIDHDRGPTNCCVFHTEQATKIIATNRETDEVALYTLEKN